MNDGRIVTQKDLHYCPGGDFCAYYVNGHVPLDEFMAALREEVADDDQILSGQPRHCWRRFCRDFDAEIQVIVEARPESKGAFPVTWIQKGRSTQ